MMGTGPFVILRFPEDRDVLQFDFDESVGYWVCTTSHAMRRCLGTELAKENTAPQNLGLGGIVKAQQQLH